MYYMSSSSKDLMCYVKVTYFTKVKLIEMAVAVEAPVCLPSGLQCEITKTKCLPMNNSNEGINNKANST
jgi:hypothetical protein